MFRRLIWLVIIASASAVTLRAQDSRSDIRPDIRPDPPPDSRPDGRPSSRPDDKNAIGATLDLTGGSTNRLSANQAVAQPFFFFYGAIPSVSFVSSHERSVLNGSYTYGLNRSTTQNLTQHSNSASLSFSRPLNSEWKVNFSENFISTADAGTFNVLRGVGLQDINSPLVFSPVALQIMTRTNAARAEADYKVSDRSTVSMSVSDSLRSYLNSGAAPSGTLTNLQRVSGEIIYGWQPNAREKFSVGYTTDYFNFTNSQNAYSDAGHVGYSTQLKGGLSLDVTVGLSRVKSQSSVPGYFGYNTSATLQKTANANSFSLYYAQTSGDSSGLGTISDTSRGGLTWKRAARRAVLSLDSSVYDTRGSLGNSYNARGVAGALTVGIPLSNTLSIQGGVQYQETATTSGYGFSQKRVFFTLHYNEPNIWHIPW